MANTFTMEELAAFKLPEKTPAAAPAAKTESTPPVVLENQPAESSAADPAPDDVQVDNTSAESTPAPAAEAAPADGGETPQANEKFIPKGRFNEVIEERNALRKYAEYLQSQIQVPSAAQSAAPAPASQPAPVAASPEGAPTLASVGYDTAAYEQAMQAWTNKQIEAAKNQGIQAGQQQQAANDFKAAFEARMATYVAAVPSVKIALGNPHLPQLAKDAAEVVMGSELGPQILHHIANNPDEAVRIARKTPAQQAAAIGRIEGELRAKASKPQQKTTNNITRAPNPPTPNTGRGNTPSVDPAKMSAKEWIEWDRQQTMAARKAKAALRR